MERPQAQRQPSGHQPLQVREMSDTKRRERVDRRRHGRCIASFRQEAREQVHADAGVGVRSDEREVVYEDRIRRQPLEGRRQHRDAEEVIGIR